MGECLAQHSSTTGSIAAINAHAETETQGAHCYVPPLDAVSVCMCSI